MKKTRTNAEISSTKKSGNPSPKAPRVNTPSALQIWKQIDDELVPRLRLSPIDCAAYCHLLRHSRLAGKHELRFSFPWLARGICLSIHSTRLAVRRLLEKGALRLVDRTKAGHLMEVRLPEEIPTAQETNFLRLLQENALEDVDFFQNKELREAIYARDGGRCFFCLRRLTPEGRCLDHLVPQAQMGSNSYRNLVSCCQECNSQKGERNAADFLRWLFREGKLTTAELKRQLRALEALATGNLPPGGIMAEGHAMLGVSHRELSARLAWVKSWEDRQIVISGFSGAYGSGEWKLVPGDQIEVAIWNPQSGRGPVLYHLSVSSPAN